MHPTINRIIKKTNGRANFCRDNGRRATTATAIQYAPLRCPSRAQSARARTFKFTFFTRQKHRGLHSGGRCIPPTNASLCHNLPASLRHSISKFARDSGTKKSQTSSWEYRMNIDSSVRFAIKKIREKSSSTQQRCGIGMRRMQRV